VVQIHSPRPFLLEPIIYSHTHGGSAPGIGPGCRRFKFIRPGLVNSRPHIDLLQSCELFHSTKGLSNLSNNRACSCHWTRNRLVRDLANAGCCCNS
jgi:hypothetical protein